MSDCISNGVGGCVNCGWKYKGKRQFPRHTCLSLIPKKSPGDWLHLAILRWVGEGPTRKCGCKDRIAKMNKWGPAGCRERLDEIVGWMEAEAKKRGWWKLVVAVPIIPRLFIRQMILGAIEKAAATAHHSQQPASPIP